MRALAGSHVVNRASVLLSLRPGFGWGWKSAAVFAWFRGGALEGTHGGLDQDASVGFLLADRPALWPGPVTTPSRALGCPDLEAGRVSTRPASTGDAPPFTVR